MEDVLYGMLEEAAETATDVGLLESWYCARDGAARPRHDIPAHAPPGAQAMAVLRLLLVLLQVETAHEHDAGPG